MGENPNETGAGELFRIDCVSEAEAKEIAAADIGGAKVFAKDEDGRYYVFRTPTDVRYARETKEQMVADQAQWDALIAWAGTVPDDILRREVHPVQHIVQSVKLVVLRNRDKLPALQAMELLFLPVAL